jgi:hypothetical protein
VSYYSPIPTTGAAPLSGAITFREAGFGRGTGPFTFGTAAPQGSLTVMHILDTSFPIAIPSVPGSWITIDSLLDGGNFAQVLAYQVAGPGGLADTGTWANATGITWWSATNPRNTWIIGADGEVSAVDTICTYAGCTPNGTEDWAVSFHCCSGGFNLPALTVGTNVTQRLLNNAADPRLGVYDSNGVATTWPGQVITPVGFSGYLGYALPIRAGA